MATESFLDKALKALKAEEERTALKVGRGQIAPNLRDEHIGVAKGLARAMDILREAARPEDKEDEV